MERNGKRHHLPSSRPAKLPSQRRQPKSPDQSISDSEDPKPVEAPASPGPSSPPARWPGRQFERCAQRSPVSPEARQKILSSFDFEKPYLEQSESDIRDLEKWMGFEGWPFVNESDRQRVVCTKAHRILHKFLWSHRYHWLTDACVDGKLRLIISPREGVTPKPLPDWLTTPYIHCVPHQDFSYKPESN